MPFDSTAHLLSESPGDETPFLDRRQRWTGVSSFLLGVLVAVGIVSLYIGLSRWVDGADSLAQLSLYSDERGDLDIDEVAALPAGAFKPVSAQVSLGYSSAVRWFRVEMPSGTVGQQTLVVQPSYLDDVRLYLRDARQAGGWRLEQQGDRFAFAQRPREDLAFTAEAEFSAGVAAFVRVKTRNAHNVRVRVIDPRTAHRENAWTLAGVGLYGGVVFVLACASAMSAALQRDRYWAVNALFQLTSMVTMFSYFGLGAQFLFPEAPRAADLLSVWCGYFHFFFGALFYRLFHALYGVPRWLLRLQTLTLLFLPTQILLMAVGRSDLALQLPAILMPVSMGLGLVSVFMLRCHDTFLLNLLRVNAITTTAYFIVLYVAHLGWFQAGFLHLYPGVFINLLTAVLLHLVLLRRNFLLSRQQQLDQREFALVQQQMHIERQKREEDGRFLSMLLHEIRSPLSVVALARSALERKLPQIGHATRDAAARDLQRIEASVQQMREVLQQVQATSELEYRMNADEGLSAKAALGTCELSALLNRLLAEHVRHASVDTAQLSSFEQGGRWVVAGGLERVLMMIRNLVDNAIKYSVPGSMVVLDMAVRPMSGDWNSQCALAVRNQVGAVGMPDPQRVFEKYYRGPNAHQYSGSGLGLYWVRGLAQMLGGDVGCSVQGSEVTFTLVLPILAAGERCSTFPPPGGDKG